MEGGTLSVLVTDGITAASVGPGGPAKAPKKGDGGPKPEDTAEKGKTATERLFEGISLYARGPAFAFLTCPLPA
jgi:hypothetical protein